MFVIRSMSRRAMLRTSAASLLAAGCWPGSLEAEADAAPGEFWFLAVNDLHYVDQRCGKWFESVVRQMKGHAEKIDFCLAAGDLTEHGTAKEHGPMREVLQALGFPCYVVIGNHDYRTQTDRKAYDDCHPDRTNYHFEHRGWQFLGLDSSDGVKYQKVAASPQTLRWLDDTLPKLGKKKPTVVFTHFPVGPLVIYRLTNADDLLDRFKEFNLQAVFSGHFHSFTERKVAAVTLTTNRCCSFARNNHDGTKEKGYFLCHARDGKITRKFIEVKPA